TASTISRQLRKPSSFSVDGRVARSFSTSSFALPGLQRKMSRITYMITSVESVAHYRSPLDREQRPQPGHTARDARLLDRFDHRRNVLVGAGRLLLEAAVVLLQDVPPSAHAVRLRID